MKNIYRCPIGIILILLFVTLTECKLIKRQAQENNLVKECTSQEENAILVIKGNIVKLSDIDKKHCKSKLNAIHLFATEKAVIDVNLDLVGDGILLAIMAPMWQVITNSGIRTINLNGINGDDPDEKKSQNGTIGGNRDGADGLAGQAGGPAGSFFGVANIIENGEKLEVLANGGLGGAGQDGGDGAKGEDGEIYKGSSEGSRACYDSPTIEWKGKWKKTDEGLLVYGMDGKRGGTGGSGGVGGIGGNRGDIQILKLLNNNEDSVETSSAYGVSGKEGSGGNPGRGGKHGHKVRVICPKSPNHLELPRNVNENNIEKLAETGFEGKSGVSRKFQKTLWKLPIQNIAGIVDRYKQYLRQCIAKSDLNNKEELSKFYNNLMEHESIAKLSDIRNLVEEFTSLEKQHYNLHKGMDFTFSYEALQRRIASYIKRPNKLVENINGYEYLLSDLNEDILRRLEDLKHSQPPFNVKPNAKKEARNKLIPLITNLTNLQIFHNVLHLTTVTLSPLESEIKKGEHINEILQNALNNLGSALNEKLDFILKKMTQLKNKEQVDKDELKKQREKLNNLTKLKAMYSAMNLVFWAQGTIYPALGIEALRGTNATDTIVAKGIYDKHDGHAVVIPDAVKQFTESTKNNLRIDFSYYIQFITQQELFTKNLKEGKSLGEAAAVDKVWDLTFRVRSALMDHKNTICIGYKMMKIYADQEIKLVTKMEELESTGVSKQSPEYLGTSIGLRAAKYLKVTSAIFQTASQTVRNIMRNENAVNEVESAIMEDEQTRKVLNDAQEMCTEIEPLLGEIPTKLNNLLKNKGSPSTLQPVLKQNFRTILNNIWNISNLINENLETKSDLDWAVNSCKEQFYWMFESHNQLLRIAETRSRKIEMTNLRIGHSSNLLVGDSELQNALSELQVVMASNVLVERYQEWISDFKQYAFPYTGSAVENFQNLDIFKDEDIKVIANDIKRNITRHRDIFSYSNVFAEGRYYAVFYGSVSKNEGRKIPIYVWKNEDMHETIDKILSGEEGQLVADIGRDSRDALKFKRVRIVFTTKLSGNETNLSQENLNRLLSNFDVEMTHNGSSTYKFRNSIYKCVNSPTVFKFPYLPRRSRNVVGKSQGLHVLSPYTTWSIKLIPPKNHSFQSIEKYKGKVDLELVGNVEYYTIPECDKNCERIMAEYYKVEGM